MNKYKILSNLISMYNSKRLDNEFYSELSSLVSSCIESKHYNIKPEDKSEVINEILIVLYTKISSNKLSSVNNIDKYIDKLIPIYCSKIHRQYSHVTPVEIDRSDNVITSGSTRSVSTTLSSNYYVTYNIINRIYDTHTRYKVNSKLYTYTKISYLLSVYNILINMDDNIILYNLDNSYIPYIKYLISVLKVSLLK